MNFLQQPVLFASEPTSGLVGLGLLLTLTAIVFVVSLIVAFALTTSERPKSKSTRQHKPQRPQQTPACGEVALS
jgi:hypothetical protein